MVDITVEELKQKLDSQDEYLFIDVREQYEFDEFNLGARLIPLGELMGAMGDLELYKEKEVIIHCRSGNRSGMAKQLMAEAGFKNVRNVLGGVLDWQEKFPA